MKLSDCKTKKETTRFLEGEVWNINVKPVAKDQIVVKRHKGVFTAYDKVCKDELGELYSSKDEARLVQIEGWMSYLRGQNANLARELGKNNRKLFELESEARVLEKFLKARGKQ